MYLSQSDLFLGMGHQFLKNAMALSERLSLPEGCVIFSQGEAAHHFFILIDGCATLRVEGSGTVYNGCRVGELFGWSSLIGNPTYTATAVSTSSTLLLKFPAAGFLDLLSSEPEAATLFYAQLARALGKRLLACYEKDPA
ncbi:MAG: cyclic nucleotide-binding domain-containing protein [Pseudomonadota bacterium]